MKLSIDLSAKEEANIRAWVAYMRAHPEYVGVASGNWNNGTPDYQTRLVLEEQTRARFDEIAAQFDAPAAARVQDHYGANDMHDMVRGLNVNPDVLSFPFTGPAPSVSAGLPEGSSGVLAISRKPGEFVEGVVGVNLIAATGRGMLGQVTDDGEWFANVKLAANMTAAADVTFNVGAKPKT